MDIEALPLLRSGGHDNDNDDNGDIDEGKDNDKNDAEADDEAHHENDEFYKNNLEGKEDLARRLQKPIG